MPCSSSKKESELSRARAGSPAPPQAKPSVGSRPTPCGPGVNTTAWTTARYSGSAPPRTLNSRGHDGETSGYHGRMRACVRLQLFYAAKREAGHNEMIAFIDEHRDQFEVKAICRTVGATDCGFITSRGCRAPKTRPPSARALRDELLRFEVHRIHAENYGVYGVPKMHQAMRRAGREIGHDQIARRMKTTGLRGVRHWRKPTPPHAGSHHSVACKAQIGRRGICRPRPVGRIRPGSSRSPWNAPFMTIAGQYPLRRVIEGNQEASE